MSEQGGFPFLELPDVVIRDTFLPLLPLNTVLRLRLVSKAVKNIADNYLRIKAPSSNVIKVFFEPQIRQFVKQDEACSILQPSANLCLEMYTEHDKNPEESFRSFFSSLGLKHLTTHYSAQITTIDMPWMKLSLEGNSPEFQFCLGFENLRHLYVHSVYDRDANEKIATSTLPSTFKNLKSFGFHLYHTTTREQDNVWKFISQLKNLERFHFPKLAHIKDQPINVVAAPVDPTDDDNMNEPPEDDHRQYFVTISALVMLPKFTQMIKWRKNTELKNVTLDFLFWNEYAREENADAQMQMKTNLVNFAKVCAQHKINWEKIDANWLQILNKQQLDQIAPFIISIKDFKCEDLKGTVFPNVTSLTVADFLEPVRNGTLSLTSVLERMSGAVFPNLKKLHTSVTSSVEDNVLLAQTWEHFPLLEDLTLGYMYKNYLSNEAFFGRQFYPCGDRRQSPCFLRLKALKKLKIYLNEESSCVTDAVFYDVFRHMKLKEFNIHSYGSLKSISKYGIRALLTGPFFEANERFSFKDFDLKGVSKEEFSRLKREFPANQIF